MNEFHGRFRRHAVASYANGHKGLGRVKNEEHLIGVGGRIDRCTGDFLAAKLIATNAIAADATVSGPAFNRGSRRLAERKTECWLARRRPLAAHFVER